jgi:hypothetical protein
MTTKKVTKAVKPATKPAVNVIAVGRHLGESLGRLQSGLEIAATATEAINADIKTLRDAKVKLGANRRTCPVSSAIYDALPSTLKVTSRNVMLSNIRKAVNETGKFSHNPNRKTGETKAKGGKAKGAKTGSGNILISIGKGANAKDVAEKLRKGFNAMKSANDELANLAAFLLDALDDAGFPEKPAK